MNQNKLQFLKQEKEKNRRKEGRKQVEVKNRYKPTPQQLTASSQPETAPTASSQRVHSEFTARNSPHSEFTASSQRETAPTVSSQRVHSEFTANSQREIQQAKP